jgi:hypothetical protein
LNSLERIEDDSLVALNSLGRIEDVLQSLWIP